MNNPQQQQNSMQTSTTFHTSWGTFRLNRLPHRKNELLQAWDAADEYVLEYLAGEKNGFQDKRILLCNDNFGALAVALHEAQLQCWSDSFLSHQATLNNYALNNLDTQRLLLTDSLTTPEENPDIVIIRVPKILAFFEYQLSMLKKMLSSETQIFVLGMQKNLPSSVWGLLEKYLGKTHTPLARKKARLILVTADSHMPAKNPIAENQYLLPELGKKLIGYANVFSSDHLDIGTRFFLEHFPVIESACEIVDLGCGNGVLGLVAATKMSQARVHFVDESYMAVESARQNFSGLFDDKREAVFQAGDSLKNYPFNNIDLVLCNPPFHQQHVVGDFIARRMFKHSKKVMNTNGQLWVIGNRHLGYHKSLKLFFRQVELAASNRKFVLLKASGR